MSRFVVFTVPSLFLCGVTLVGASCAATRESTPEPSVSTTTRPDLTTKADAAPASFEGLWRHPVDPRVGAFVSSPWTFSTTSYFIEGDEDLILIDTQFLPRETLAFVDAAEQATGKKARVAVVLHANPDKFNGTAALQERGITVLTSADVSALIPSVHEKRVRAFGARYAPDYPSEAARPSTFMGDVTRVSVPGAVVELITTGAGCSESHVLAVFDSEKGRHVFAGDLLANGSHAWLEIGRTDQWLTRLDEIDALAPTFVHPGRGLSSSSALIGTQRGYLHDVIAAVNESGPVLPVDKARMTRARDAIIMKHPTLRFAVFLNIGLPAEIARQAHVTSEP
jgi:glyoxylase-like metal-dependent hydrolase (beta-lactamase superfamily II)